MNLNEKIVLALSKLLTGGDRHVTGYKLSLIIGVDRSTIYKHFKKIQTNEGI